MPIEPNLELYIKNGDKDLSGNNNSLTNNGAIIGNGVECSAGKYIDTGFKHDGSPLTLSAWVKFYDGGAAKPYAIFLNESGRSILIAKVNSGGPYFGSFTFGDSSVNMTEAIDFDTYYHFCLVADGSDFYAYVNGELKGFNSYNWSGINSNSLFLGNNSSPFFHFDGKLNDVRIYSEAKSAGWVSNCYNLTKSKYQPIEITSNAIDYLKSLNPKGLWVPPAINDTWKDYSGNGNDGTPVNANDIIYETKTNGPISAIGNYNEAVFGGNDGYINIGDKSSLEFSTEFTAVLLMKLPDWSSSSWYFFGKFDSPSNGREWAIAARGDRYSDPITVAFGDPVNGTFKANAYLANSTTLISYDTWFVLCVTYAAGTVGFYINGSGPYSYTTTGTIPSSLYNGSASFAIATIDGLSGYETPITIALAAVYDFAWTSDQISYLQNLINI